MSPQVAGEPTTFTVRPARERDFSRIEEIYAVHVLNGTATFELVPPDAAEMLRRFEQVAARGLPWLVAEVGDNVVGYAYAAMYRARPAYDFTVEDSLYIDRAWHRRGIGRTLLDAIVRGAEARGCRQMVAVIGDSANAASIGLHRAAGFEHAGVLRNVGLKFGRWLDTVLMQRTLGEGATTVPPGG